MKWLPVTLLLWALGYLGTAMYSFFSFPQESVLQLFRFSWILRNAFRMWIDYLPALTAGSLMLSFSLFFRSFSGGSSGPDSFFGRVFPGVMAWGIALTLLYTVGAELVLPSMLQQLNDISYQSGRAKEWERQGALMESAGEYREALEAYSRALVIDPENEDLIQWKERVEGRIPLEDIPDNPETPPPLDYEEREKALRLEASNAITLAETAFGDGDYFSAHYWATFAFQLDPEQKAAAMKIARESWSAITELEPDDKELAAHGRYRKKISGYQALDRGDPIEAYRIFLELSSDEEGLSDPDISEFLVRSREAAETVSYYADTAWQAETMPGITSVLFRDGPDGPFVSARKMVSMEGRIFLLGFELFHIGDDGELVLHLSAPAVQYLGDTLLSKGIDEDSGELLRSLEILEGSGKQFGGDGWMADTELGIIRLSVDPETIRGFGSGHQRTAMVDLSSLYRSARRDSDYGYLQFPSRLELLYRGSMPFFFLNIMLLSVGLGRLLRYRGSRFPLLAVLLVPAVPFLARELLDLLGYSMRLMTALLVMNVPFVFALSGMLFLHGLMMFLVLLFSAGQRDV
jgi:tetratricopeptide (TPR) repeat protein